MEKNEQQLPRLGEPVPAFEAMTTRGKISFPADYKGKWVILFGRIQGFELRTDRIVGRQPQQPYRMAAYDP